MCKVVHGHGVLFVLLLPLVCGKWAQSGDDRDEQVSTFLEAMWSEGEARARAGDLISGVHWHYNVKSVNAGFLDGFQDVVQT